MSHTNIGVELFGKRLLVKVGHFRNGVLATCCRYKKTTALLASFSRCRQIELITSRWEWLAAALMALSLNFHLRPKVVKTFFLLFLSGDTDSNAKRFWQTLEFDKNYFAAFDNNFWGHFIDKFMRRISSLLWTLAGKYF